MNSFNNIVRIKYSENKESVVSLDEYILLADERKNEKYAIFKLFNNLNQELYGVKFEIVQYNENGNIIEKNIVNYNQVIIKKNASFIPEAKLPILPSCVRISFNLLYAHFSTTIWEEGNFRPIAIRFDVYKKDIPQTKTKKELKKELKLAKINEKIFTLEERNAEKARRKLEKDLYNFSEDSSSSIGRKNKFILKDLTKKQKPVFAKFLSIVLSLALVALISISVITSSFVSISYYDNLVSVEEFDFNYEEGIVKGYYGENLNPELQKTYTFEHNYTISQYFNYGLNYVGYLVDINDKPDLGEKQSRTFEVVEIGSKAFKGSKIESITLPSTVVKFGKDAFKNSTKLNKIRFAEIENLYTLDVDCLRNTGFEVVELNSVLTVEDGAFADCKNLEVVKLSQAQVEKNAFEGSTEIRHLDIGSTKVSKLADLFGGEVPEDLVVLNLNNMFESDLPADFLVGCNENIRVFVCGNEILNYRRLF